MEVDLKPGDIIQDYCEPFVKVLHGEEKGRRCDYCFEENGNLSHCAQCKVMFYCNKVCQKMDWKEGHKFECKLEALSSDRCHLVSQWASVFGASEDTVNKLVERAEEYLLVTYGHTSSVYQNKGPRAKPKPCGQNKCPCNY